MKKHVKKVAVVTAMCGAMLMTSCTKREMLTPVAPPTEATQESPTDAPGIYIETADGVVHNTGLRATASETREWTSPDGSIRVTGLGTYDQEALRVKGATVGFHVKEGFGLERYAYRFEGETPVVENAQKEKDRVWRNSYRLGDGLTAYGTDKVVFYLPGGDAERTSQGVSITEDVRKVILRADVSPLPKSFPKNASDVVVDLVYNLDIRTAQNPLWSMNSGGGDMNVYLSSSNVQLSLRPKNESALSGMEYHRWSSPNVSGTLIQGNDGYSDRRSMVRVGGPAGWKSSGYSINVRDKFSGQPYFSANVSSEALKSQYGGNKKVLARMVIGTYSRVELDGNTPLGRTSYHVTFDGEDLGFVNPWD